MSRYLTLSVVCLLFPLAAGAQEKKGLPDCHVLGIGIDLYADQPKLTLPGNSCVNDATNLVQRMKDQAGKLFARVSPHLLADSKATSPNVDKIMKQLAADSKSGDWVVLILSSHGGGDPKTRRWAGLLHDLKELKDTTILQWSKQLAEGGRKVVIIVDACDSGLLGLNAAELLERYTDSTKGGIILMLSSMPTEFSEALPKYSSFAESVNQGLLGGADYNGDGNITLKELAHFAYRRTYELNRLYLKQPLQPQDGEIVWSFSISETLVVGKSQMKTLLQANADLTTDDDRDTQRKECYRKIYKVKLEQGVSYVIELKSSWFNSYVRLEDGGGKQLAFNDGVGGANHDARVVYTPNETGEFRVVVTTKDNNATGAFTLKVRQKLNLATVRASGQ